MIKLAEKLEQSGRQEEAIKIYLNVAARHPSTNSPIINACKRRVDQLLKERDGEIKSLKQFYSRLKQLKSVRKAVAKAKRLQTAGQLEAYGDKLAEILKRHSSFNHPIMKTIQNAYDEYLAQSIVSWLDTLKQLGIEHAAVVPPTLANLSEEHYFDIVKKSGYAVCRTPKEIIRTGKLPLIRSMYLFMPNCNEFDAEGLKPIHHFIIAGINEDSEQILKALLSTGLTIDERNAKGHTPLQMLAMISPLMRPEAAIAMAKLLIQNGADVNAVNSKSPATVLYYATQGDRVNLPFVKTLIEQGAATKLSDVEDGLVHCLANSASAGGHGLAGLNALLQLNQVLVVSFKIRPDLVPQLNAGEGIVFALINGEFVNPSLKNFRGFKQAIVGVEGMANAFTTKQFTIGELKAVYRIVEQKKDPLKDKATIEVELNAFCEELVRGQERMDAQTALMNKIQASSRRGDTSLMLSQVNSFMEQFSEGFPLSDNPTSVSHTTSVTGRTGVRL